MESQDRPKLDYLQNNRYTVIVFFWLVIKAAKFHIRFVTKTDWDKHPSIVSEQDLSRHMLQIQLF